MDASTETRPRERAAAPRTPLIVGKSDYELWARFGAWQVVATNPKSRITSLQRDRRALFVFLIRLDKQFAQLVLPHRVEDGAEKREAPALAVDGICARRKRDVPAVTGPPFPHGEANQLESGERTVSEM